MGASTPFPTPAETLEDALSPGAARRRALDAALAEIDGGANQPSIEWRRQFSLLLGLERVLSEEEPQLVDGTVLSRVAGAAGQHRTAGGTGGDAVDQTAVADPQWIAEGV